MSATTLKKVILFLVVNAGGFSSSTISFLLGLQIGRFSGQDEFALSLVQGTTMTWAVCGIFSFAYFFFEGTWGRIFLWSALIVPLFYGLSVLLVAG